MKYNGIVTPMITPFNSSGEVDFETTERLLDYFKTQKLTGIFPLGSTGLFPFLFPEERVNFLQFVNERKGSLKLFAGIGSSNTEECINLARNAEDVGSDVIVMMPNYYIRPSQEEIYNHFAAVLKNVDMDFFIYNIPQLAGVVIAEETIDRIRSEFSQVKGLKESSGDFRYFARIMQLSSPEFSIFQGQDDLLLPSLSLGADGGVCGLTNFNSLIPDTFASFTEGRLEDARRSQMQANRIMYVVNKPNFPSGYYFATYLKLGVTGGYRTPMLEPSEQDKQAITGILQPSEPESHSELNDWKP